MINETCENITDVSQQAAPTFSALMFGAGVLGNALALVVLGLHKRDNRSKVSLFHILVSSLIVTDLMGTLLISPMVLTAYGRGRTLKELKLCDCCAYAMAFFGLTSMFILFTMALERCLSISCPYFYQRHTSKRCGLVAIPAIYIFCLLFCSLPLLGFGSNVQYCPGTWCFIKMKVQTWNQRVYSLSYAILMKVLIVSILLCNISVIVNLCRMYQRQKRRRRSSTPRARRNRFSHSEEVDHLILLALMTITFVICSVPLTIRAYIGAFSQDDDYESDLQALRSLSFNSIIDPWVFIILNTSMFKKMLSRILCCKITSKRQEQQTTSFIRIEMFKQESLWDRQS